MILVLLTCNVVITMVLIWKTILLESKIMNGNMTAAIFQTLEAEEQKHEDVIGQLKQLTTDICIQVMHLYSIKKYVANIFSSGWNG